MNESGMTEEKIQGGNMPLIFGVTYLFSCMLALAMFGITIHQMGFSIDVDE